MNSRINLLEYDSFWVIPVKLPCCARTPERGRISTPFAVGHPIPEGPEGANHQVDFLHCAFRCDDIDQTDCEELSKTLFGLCANEARASPQVATRFVDSRSMVDESTQKLQTSTPYPQDDRGTEDLEVFPVQRLRGR